MIDISFERIKICFLNPKEVRLRKKKYGLKPKEMLKVSNDLALNGFVYINFYYI